MDEIKKMIIGVAIAGLIGYGPVANAGGSAELMAGQKDTTLDVKVASELAPKTNLFIRDTTTVGYDNQVDHFGLVDLSYNLVGGLDVVVETQFIPGVGVIPRLGSQYFKEVDDLSVYALATAGLNGKEVDAEVLVNLTYVPKLSENLNLVLNAENVTNLGKDGHNFSTQFLRTGLSNGTYEAGLGLNLAEADGEFSGNLGEYMKANF
ncbi:hypothetical protein HOC01_00640 [archaeon]|jgi:hypothetical protein|nr:hypothetical protein [archaeon]MBT6698652.1 hypothetical protein [archaeon]